MADNSTSPGTGAEQALGKFFVRVGMKIDPANEGDLKKSLGTFQKYIKDFNKNTDFKDSYFGKMPGIKKTMQSLVPDNMRFLKSMLEIGNASKNGADGMAFYQNELGFMGKGLVNLTSIFMDTGEGATAMGWLVQEGAALATFGITALIAIGVLLLQGFKNLIMAGIDWQNQLNDINKLMGGVSKDRLMKFNEGLNTTIKNLSAQGFAFQEITNSVKAYMASGLNPAIAMESKLIKTTLQLSEITGESATELAGFFSGILRGSKITNDSLNALGGSFTEFNKAAEKSGIIGSISFGDVQEAVNSVGTALLLASQKGKSFTNTMMNDLVALTGMAKILNISVSDLNNKFEEAGNLLTSQESGFRAILAISGAANMGNLLTNQFNKTEAMLKVADQLRSLNMQFGGNLNILGQVAEQTFGLSKDVAIKLATMSIEQRKTLEQAKQDSLAMQSTSLDKSFKSVTNTISSSFERFKDVLINAFHRAFAGNTGLQNFLSKFGTIMNRWVSEIANPDSGFGKIIDRFSSLVTWLFDNLSKWLDKLEPTMNNLMDWLDKFMSSISDGSFIDNIGSKLENLLDIIINKAVTSAAMAIGKLAARVILAVSTGGLTEFIPMMWKKFVGAAEAKDDARKTALTDWSSKAAKQLSDALNKNRKEQSRLEGLKDTDIVVGKKGQFSLAGLERLELMTEEEKLQDAQNKITEANTKAIELNTQALTNLLNNAGVIPTLGLSHGVSGSWEAPPAPVSSPAKRTIHAAIERPTAVF